VRLLTSLVSILLLIAACRGSGDPTPTPDPSKIARDIQLSLPDLPPNWHETPQGGAVASNVRLSPACDIFNLDIVFPDAVAAAQSLSFQGPDKQQVQSFAAIYGGSDDAQKAVDGTQDIADRCGDEFKDTLKGLAEGQLSAFGVDVGVFAGIDVGIIQLNDPPLGEASTGYRVHIEVSIAGSSRGKFTIDYRVFRQGNIAAAVLYAASGDPGAAEENAIDQAIVNKAAAPHT
jgi:hypothetical protein